MKQPFTYLALAVLGLTLTACHTKDELPQTEEKRIERPDRISAPFIGQVYTDIQSENNGAAQLNYFLELKDDGTIDYKRVRDTEANTPERITGKYTYDPATKKVTFSELSSSFSGAKEPKDLFLENVVYDETRDAFVGRNGADDSDVYFIFYNLSATIPAPFVGRTYVVITADQDGVQTRQEVDFYTNKRVYGRIIRQGKTQNFSGDYDYNFSASTFTFSGLLLDGVATTAEAVGLDQNPRYVFNENSLHLGGKSYLVSGRVEETPMTAKTYAVTYEKEDQTAVYRREVSFHQDGTISGRLLQNGVQTDTFTGVYSYNKDTHAVTFSNLLFRGASVTPEALYLAPATYDTAADYLTMLGSYYQLSNKVAEIKPSNPPAFYDKVYVVSWVAEGKTYKETFQLMANGVVLFNSFVDDVKNFSFRGRYTYDGTTHALSFSDLLDTTQDEYKNLSADSYNAGDPQYVPANNTFYITQTTYSLQQ